MSLKLLVKSLLHSVSSKIKNVFSKPFIAMCTLGGELSKYFRLVFENIKIS